MPLPEKFKMLNIGSYNGTKEPLEHLKNNKGWVDNTYNDAIRYRAFILTLIDKTWAWYRTLKPNIISSFIEFEKKLISHFIAHQMTLCQGKYEALKDFFNKFNGEKNPNNKFFDSVALYQEPLRGTWKKIFQIHTWRSHNCSTCILTLKRWPTTGKSMTSQLRRVHNQNASVRMSPSSQKEKGPTRTTEMKKIRDEAQATLVQASILALPWLCPRRKSSRKLNTNA